MQTLPVRKFRSLRCPSRQRHQENYVSKPVRWNHCICIISRSTRPPNQTAALPCSRAADSPSDKFPDALGHSRLEKMRSNQRVARWCCGLVTFYPMGNYYFLSSHCASRHLFTSLHCARNTRSAENGYIFLRGLVFYSILFGALTLHSHILEIMIFKIEVNFFWYACLLNITFIIYLFYIQDLQRLIFVNS